MLNITVFTFNDFQENTYLISNEKKQCWIVDPGMYYEREKDNLYTFIKNNNFVPQAVINTHAHIDHIFGVQNLMNKYNIPFGLHKDEVPMLSYSVHSASLFGINFRTAPIPSFFIEDGKPFILGDEKLEVLLCPGHSSGSIVFYYAKGNWAIVGDVLFAGSIGRSDLPGGNFETLIDSIKTNLLTLPPDTVIYSGHGSPTTIEAEKSHNPFL